MQERFNKLLGEPKESKKPTNQLHFILIWLQTFFTISILKKTSEILDPTQLSGKPRELFVLNVMGFD